MAKGREGEWIEAAVAALSSWGPGWVILGVVGIVLVLQLPKIIPACGNVWKTYVTTKQKLRHQQRQFDHAMSNRVAKVNAPRTEAAPKKSRRNRR
jgi:hypothetical protein